MGFITFAVGKRIFLLFIIMTLIVAKEGLSAPKPCGIRIFIWPVRLGVVSTKLTCAQTRLPLSLSS